MTLFSGDVTDFQTLRDTFRWQVPEHFNMGRAVCAGQGAGDDRPALLYEHADGTTRRLSFGELREFSDRFANALRALGVERGDRVAVILPQRPEAPLAHLAIYKLGAVALPLSVLFGPDAIEYRLRDSGARAVVTDSRVAAIVEPLRDGLPSLEHVVVCDPQPGGDGFWDLVDRAAPSLGTVNTRAEDPALLIYTSGTTGPPKGALNAHRCLIGNLPGFELSQNFFPRPGDLFWTPADWAWTGGLLDALLPSLYYGVPVLGYEGGRFDPERACDLMVRYRVRNAFIPPTALKMFMQIPGVETSLKDRLRGVMSAGEQVGEEVVLWARDALGLDVNEMWGQTEFNYLVGNCAPALPPRPGSMGRPYPGHDVAVLDPSGTPLPDGETGELAARRADPVMFLGYWQREEATRAKFAGDWFLTGDLGYRDSDGYLWFVGREDDVINTAGHRVGPGEVEDSLLKHPAVAQAAVVGSPDPLRGNVLKAFVVLASEHAPSPELVADIQDSVKRRLAAHEYPREVEFIDSLPTTTTGKVRRGVLRERERRRKSAGS